MQSYSRPCWSNIGLFDRDAVIICEILLLLRCIFITPTNSTPNPHSPLCRLTCDFACKPGADTDLAGNKMAQSEDGGESSVKGKGKNPTMLRRRVPKMLLGAIHK